MSEKLTTEQINTKAEELSKLHGVKVSPIVFSDAEDKEQVVGYLKEPNRLVKMRVLDKSVVSPITAAAEMLEIIIIKDESDPRILSEAPENDRYYMGAVMAATNMIKYSVDTFKKK